MGHPPKEELTRMLAASNSLSSSVLTGLETLRCGSCLRMSLPKKPPVTSTSNLAANQFGDRLQCDVVYIRTLVQNVPVLGMIDEFTNYMVAHSLQDRQPSTTLKMMKQLWYHPLGLPQHVTVDPDTIFLGETEDWHHRYAINYDIIPAEEHWRIGKIERRNSLMRSLVERLVDHHGITSREVLDDAITAATFSLNSSTYTYGRSPFQAVFGRIPRPLGDLVSDEKALVISPSKDEHQLRPELLRAEATTTLMQLSASQAVRRGLLRKTRQQQELHMQPGQTIAFWRWQGRARQHKRGSWSLGRFLAYDPDRKSCWIQVGKTSTKVGLGQVRLGTGWETWTPSEEDVKLLRDAEANISAGLWDDDRGDPPGEDEAAILDQEVLEDDIFNFRPLRERANQLPPLPQPTNEQAQQGETEATPMSTPGRAEESPLDLTTIPAPQQTQSLQQPIGSQLDPAQVPLPQTIVQQQSQQQYQHLQQQHQHTTYHDNRQINIRLESPSREEYQQFGQSNYGAVPRTPRNRPRSRTPSRAADLTEQSKQRPATPPLQRQSASASTQVQPPTLQDAITQPQSTMETQQMATESTEPLPQLPMKRPAEVMHTTLQYNSNNTITTLPTGWDGSPDPSFSMAKHEIYYQAYLNSKQRQIEMADIAEPQRPDLDSSSDEDLAISNNRDMTRQEQKQLDREIPWRQIVQEDSATFWKYVDSASNEYNGWLEWNGIQPVDPKETARIYADPNLRRRIIKARAAYRDKARGVPPLRPKCRVVLIGCGDPDLKKLSRDSPTPTRTSELVILAVATSGYNREFNHDHGRWRLLLLDAEKAFLQGKQDDSERDGPLYMQSPRDPILIAANAYPCRALRSDRKLLWPFKCTEDLVS